jgi:hypothetical protein
MREGILAVLTGLLVFWEASWSLQAAPSGEAPDFKEVYDLIRTNVAGVSQAQLDRAAVQALVSSLAPKVLLAESSTETNLESNAPLLSKATIFSGDIAYLRVARVESGLPEAVRQAVQGLLTTNKLQGIVLDLRFTPGHNFDAATGVADLFLSKERPLLDWGTGMKSSTAKTDALKVPLAVLVNHDTTAAAEALAAILRDTGASLVLGNRTAGQAMISQEFTLKNGEHLRIATAPIKLGSGALLTAEGVNPDIAVRVGLDEERSYFIDAFKTPPATNSLVAGVNLSLTNQSNLTNRSRRSRFNEAELVREKREGTSFDPDLSLARNNEPEKPVVRDPVLARALDIIKGLAVVRQSRS